MDILDKKKLSILLKKIKVKNFSNKNNEEINLEIIKKIKDLSKKEKNKKRKEQLDLLEKKYDLKILRKDQLDKLPNWIKKQLKDCKVIGNSKKVILTKNSQKYHLDNKLNDLAGNQWNYFLRCCGIFF